MDQKIDFYRYIPKLPKYILTPNIVGYICTAVALFLALVSVVQYAYLKTDTSTLSKLDQREKAAIDFLAGFQGKQDDSTLKVIEKINELRGTIQQKKNLLEMLGGISFEEKYAFSSKMIALSEAIQPGVWLEQINFIRRGKEIGLVGCTVAKQNLFDFLNVLDKKEMFKKYNFKVADFSQKSQDDKCIKFNVIGHEREVS